jgi:hypothetical protein
MPLSMVIADPNRPDCPIVYVDRAFNEVAGYSPTMAIGRNCRFPQATTANSPRATPCAPPSRSTVPARSTS